MSGIPSTRNLIGRRLALRIEGHRREKNNNRLPERVRSLHRQIERWIIDASLGALHPVDDASAIGIGQP